MDAARAVKGHGWPLYGDPRSDGGENEPRRSRGRMQGQDFLVPFGVIAKRNSRSSAKQKYRNTRKKDWRSSVILMVVHLEQAAAEAWQNR
ncbi:MAG: hypothetical protein BFD77_01370 [Pseudomonas sp. CO183]|nr:MAG: hypothetical protein BFD77_01370 [Pseudomonas sp. CO183]